MPAPIHSLPGCLLACCMVGALVSACKLYEHDADAAQRMPCVETNEPLTPALAERVSVNPSLLLDKARGRHASRLVWSTGQRTDIAFVLTDPDIYYVRSRLSAQLPPFSDAVCTGRTEIRGRLAIDTGDGQLAEKRDVVLTGNGSDEVYGLVSIPAATIGGTYEQRPRTDERCLDRLDLRVLFAADGVHGTVTEVSTLRACTGGPSDDSDQEYGVASWGSRPLHY